MARQGKPRGTRGAPPVRRVVPPSDPSDRCVWMTAGVLSYWLCPRNFACDRCPVDRILSGREAVIPVAPDDVLHRADCPVLGRLRVPLRRRPGLHYHPAHLWAREVEPGRIRLGLDDIAARLTEGAEGWQLAESGERLGEGDPLARTRVEQTPVQMATPVAGRVVARNQAARRHPALVTWSPYDAGWLVEMEVEPDVWERRGFLQDEELVRAWFESDLDRLAARSRRDEASGELGPTLQDGGHPRCTLRELLSRKGYRKALEALSALNGIAD